jgi:hypothetical protein
VKGPLVKAKRSTEVVEFFKMSKSALCLKATKGVAKPGSCTGQLRVVFSGYDRAPESAQGDPKRSVGGRSVFPLLENLMREVLLIYRPV